MADVIQFRSRDRSVRSEPSRRCMARDIRDWYLHRASGHLKAAAQISRQLGECPRHMRNIDQAVRLLNRYRRPRALDLSEPRQMDLFVERT